MLLLLFLLSFFPDDDPCVIDKITVYSDSILVSASFDTCDYQVSVKIINFNEIPVYINPYFEVAKSYNKTDTAYSISNHPENINFHSKAKPGQLNKGENAFTLSLDNSQLFDKALSDFSFRFYFFIDAFSEIDTNNTWQRVSTLPSTNSIEFQNY